MGGPDFAPRAEFARVPCSDPDVSVFRLSGSLGPLARPQLERLTTEIQRRWFPHVVLDLSSVEALGGRAARLLVEFASARAKDAHETVFVVDSPTVRGFLTGVNDAYKPRLATSLEQAVRALRSPSTDVADTATEGRAAPGDESVLFLAESGPVPAANDANGGGAAERRPDAGLVEGGLEGLLQESDAASRQLADERFDPTRSAASHPQARNVSQTQTGVASSRSAFASTPAVSSIAAHPHTTLANPGDSAVEPSATFDSGDVLQSITAAVREAELGSRIYVFKLHTDDQFHMLTRHGFDPDRAFPTTGRFCQQLRVAGGLALVFDLCEEVLSRAEEDLLTELNCEVAKLHEATGLLVLLSKERAGDEYTLEELQALNEILSDTVARLVTQPSSERAPLPVAHAEEVVAAAAPVAPVPREAAPVVAVEDPVSDIERALRRKLTHMRDILRLSLDFDAAFGTSRILEVLVLSVVSLARVERVLYFGERGGAYQLTHDRGLDPEAARELRLESESTLVETIVASPKALCLQNDERISPEERIWATQLGIQYGVAFRVRDQVVGLILFGSARQAVAPDVEVLSYLFAQGAMAYDRAELAETLQDRTLGVVRGLVTVIESRHGWDTGSTEQVVRYTQALARELQFPAQHLRDLIFGAVLRDVGMLRIGDSVLNSAQDLSAEQWEAIRRHPIEGASILRQMRFSPIAVDIVMHHHESYNGEGYPTGLRGRAIPLGARIVAVAEAFVKMTLDRPYRRALGRAEALENMAENWSLRYDPLVVDALLRAVNRELSAGLGSDSQVAQDLFAV